MLHLQLGLGLGLGVGLGLGLGIGLGLGLGLGLGFSVLHLQLASGQKPCLQFFSQYSSSTLLNGPFFSPAGGRLLT